MAGVIYLLAVMLLCGKALGQNHGAPNSPCPNVFQYIRGQNGGWQGRVSIIPPIQFSEAKLQLKMTVNYFPLTAGVGEISFTDGKLEIQAISDTASRNERQQINYVVNFPPGKPLPRVAQVVINGKEFCPNVPTYPDTRGEINLSYKVNTGLRVAVVGGNQFTAPGNGLYVDGARPGAAPYVPKPIATEYPPDYHQPAQYRPTTPAYRPTQRPVQTQRPYYEQSTTSRPYYEQSTTRRTQQYRPEQATSDQCGIRQVTGSYNQLIVRGELTERGMWPWHAAIYKHYTDAESYYCGGVLVSRRHVLTAAHCVTSKSNKYPDEPDVLYIRLGRFDLDVRRETGEQEIGVNRIDVHENYGLDFALDHDVAVLTLSESARISDFVAPVCLWDLTEDLGPLVGKKGTVVGWGRDENGKLGPKLKQISMEIVSEVACKADADAFYFDHVTDVTYCAGYRNGSTVCNGDSGGGMFVEFTNPKQRIKTWYVRGLVSLGKFDDKNQCADEEFVIFADLAKVKGWIQEKMGQISPRTTARTPTKNKTECGYATSPDTTVPLIIGGKETEHGQWPWHIALYRLDEIEYKETFLCGGTLLSRNLVVTAAHCVTQSGKATPRESAELLVYVGKYNLQALDEIGSVKMQVSNVRVHPKYNPNKVHNDLALLTLSTPVTYSDYVKPVCLWDREETQISNIVGKEGTVVGWGYDETYEQSDILLEFSMPVVSLSDCVKSNPDHFSQFTSDTNYCAGYRNDTGVCNGDSGGGMFFSTAEPDNRKKWYLRGLVSSSVITERFNGDVKKYVCDPKHYSIFTDVAQFVDWIAPYLD